MFKTLWHIYESTIFFISPPLSYMVVASHLNDATESIFAYMSAIGTEFPDSGLLAC